MKKDYCVQCEKEIEGQTADNNYNVCMRPDCPNYGLLQMGNTSLANFVKKKKQ